MRPMKNSFGTKNIPHASFQIVFSFPEQLNLHVPSLRKRIAYADQLFALAILCEQEPVLQF